MCQNPPFKKADTTHLYPVGWQHLVPPQSAFFTEEPHSIACLVLAAIGRIHGPTLTAGGVNVPISPAFPVIHLIEIFISVVDPCQECSSYTQEFAKYPRVCPQTLFKIFGKGPDSPEAYIYHCSAILMALGIVHIDR
jgi:hypothetical protein